MLFQCPWCGKDMTLRTDKVGRLFYGCEGFPECKYTHGAYPDGIPFGARDPDTIYKMYRRLAHAAFDEIWRYGQMSRREAYDLLNQWLGVTNAHMGSMSTEECLQVIEAVKKYKESLRANL
jgi:ssDNA-binding Zn-finger/Zn-ribbon topoisomerase 1